MEGLEGRVATLEREMGEVRKVVFVGNGHPPLTERVTAMESSLDSIKASLAKLNSGISRVVWLVLSSVIGQVLYAVLSRGLGK